MTFKPSLDLLWYDVVVSYTDLKQTKVVGFFHFKLWPCFFLNNGPLSNSDFDVIYQ